MLTRWHNPFFLGRFAAPDLDDPFSFDQLRRQMDRLFWDFERGLGQSRPGGFDPGATGWPRVGVSDQGGAFMIRAELPGLGENDVELSVTENTVTLSGERKDDTPEGYSVHRKERGAVKFSRSFELPCKVDAAKVEATMKHGVLQLTLPKAEESQPRQIAIRAS